jgi:hypothetical protein
MTVVKPESLVRVASAGVLCAVLGCSEDPAPYASYQACFDDRVDTSGLQITEAIVACCQDEIAGMTAPVCGTTLVECTAYLGDHLNDEATSGDKSAGCQQYLIATGN